MSWDYSLTITILRLISVVQSSMEQSRCKYSVQPGAVKHLQQQNHVPACDFTMSLRSLSTSVYHCLDHMWIVHVHCTIEENPFCQLGL